MMTLLELRKLIILVLATVLISVACTRNEVDYGTADVRLAQQVREQLDARPETKAAASRVQIEAKDGAVTLTGSVDTVRDKATVEQVVAQVNGVTQVSNNVIVNQPGLPAPDEPFEEQTVRTEAASSGERIGPSTEDARIYHSIRRQLIKHQSTPKQSIFVDVVGGNVTLRGTIFTSTAQAEAVSLARNTEGVKAVNDQLVVNTQLP